MCFEYHYLKELVFIEHQVRTGGFGFYCPCVKWGNVSKVNSVDILRKHIHRRWFRLRYHVWVWCSELRVYKEKKCCLGCQ